MNDWLGSWGSPDDVLKSCLIVVFGSSSVIVTVFMMVNGVLGFRGTGRTVLAGFRRAHRGFRDFRRSRPPSVAAAFFMHLIVVLLQLAWLFATFIIGVAVSSDLGVGPTLTNANFENADGFVALLRDNTPISAGILAAAVLAILAAYGRGRRAGDDMDWLIVLFGGLPVLFAWMALGGAAISALIWVVGWGADDPYANPKWIVLLLGCAAAMYAYYKACCVAMNGPKLLYRMRKRLLAQTDGVELD